MKRPHVRFRDLRVTDPVLRKRLTDAVDTILGHGMLLFGPEVGEFEAAFAAAVGRKHAVAVSSGTDALYLALRALGIGPGDEVITTSLSWIATANAIAFTGATPVCVDIEDDLNLSPRAVERAVTPRTKAIVPVHFTGRLCDMDALAAIAQKHGLLVVEDAAQAYGAHRNGRQAGSFGQAAAFSLNPMKVLPGYGEAGVVCTDDAAMVEQLRVLLYNGTVNRETCVLTSLNFKPDTIQCAMLSIGMEYAERNILAREKIAARYTAALKDCCVCPGPDGEAERSVCYDYVIQAERRGELMAFLAEAGIEVRIKHPILMPDQPAYAGLPRQDIPVARSAVQRILSLPIYENMPDADAEYVIQNILAFSTQRRLR